jgi:hypothetical protein
VLSTTFINNWLATWPFYLFLSVISDLVAFGFAALGCSPSPASPPLSDLLACLTQVQVCGSLPQPFGPLLLPPRLLGPLP